MKHTLLASTALVTMAGAAAAELTITGTARIGLVTTEGAAEIAGKTTFGKISKAAKDTYAIFGAAATAKTPKVHIYTQAASSVALGTVGDKATQGDIDDLDKMINEAQLRLTGESGLASPGAGVVTALVDTPAEYAQVAADLATLQQLRADLITVTTTTAATKDSTDAANRFRVSFTGSGETDSGLAYGATIRADNSGAGSTGSGGSPYVSGAFGKLSMGDLNGADESGAGGGVSGVGLTGLKDHNDISYQSSDHNLAYEYSTSGVTFGYSQNTAVKTGSNSAMGLKYSGDLGGASVSIGVGQSKVGTATQTSMSVSASSGGLTLKAITSTNDNGPATETTTGTTRSGDGTTAYVNGTFAATNVDTDQTAVSISYAMDAMSVTAFTKTVSTVGSADMDYSGFGFAYDLGGVSLKAGVVDANDTQLVDFGLSFSF
jgi:outer membrane protein OmpU